jgi:PilZ domain
VSKHHERRASPRCDAMKNQSRLEFFLPSGRRRVEARLINISRDGALIVALESPPADEPFRMRMENPLKTDWADAVTVRVGRDHDIAIRFPRRCPDDLLLAATVGIDLSHLFRDGDRPETMDDMGV